MERAEFIMLIAALAVLLVAGLLYDLNDLTPGMM